MERITSRKNAVIQQLRAIQAERSARNEEQLYACDGLKNLKEALHYGTQVTTILWKEGNVETLDTGGAAEYVCPEDLFDYVSTMKNSPGPLFLCRMRSFDENAPLRRVIVLENVQDPGNVGTILRTANAFRTDAVLLVDACADVYNPKTVRATMGAIFRQNVCHVDRDGLMQILKKHDLKLYGAALASDSRDLRQVSLKGAAVAVGSEGHGLSEELLKLCDEKIIIPMNPDSESLNAGVAASVLMWEMARESL